MAATTTTTTNKKGIWEGLGGPIQVDNGQLGNSMPIDPTLASCCQREIENNRRVGAVQRSLKRHDFVADRERRRRNLVNTGHFQGCRCLYDPNMDGGSDYATLERLRRKREKKNKKPMTAERNKTETYEELYCVNINQKISEDDYVTAGRRDDENENTDSDDEFDYLLDEDIPGEDGEELRLIEEQRRLELERELMEREIQLQHGYGAHRPMHPSRVLKAAGLLGARRRQQQQQQTQHDAPLPSAAVVLHLYDSQTVASASVDLYLEELSTQKRGTQFLRSEGRSTVQLGSSYFQTALPRLRLDQDIPLLLAVKDGVIVQSSPLHSFTNQKKGKSMTRRSRTNGIQSTINENDNESDDDDDDMDDDSCIIPEAVYNWLNQLGVLHDHPPRLESLCFIRPEEEALMDYLATQKPRRATAAAVEEDFYPCGIPGCQKSFAHQHVGIETKEQSGLVVSENEIMGKNS